jgi:ATP-dependent DNA helicase RecQ
VTYCQEKGLASLIHEKKEKKEKKEKEETARKKGDTHALSFQMYREGKSIAEIAKERNLAIQTIEGHLSKYIQSGELDIAGFVSSENIALIEAALKDFNGGSITPIKQALGDNISFGEIRMVLAKMEAEKKQA